MVGKLQKQNGLTLVEALLVLGILAIVLAVVVPIALSAGATQQAQNESRLIQSVASKIQNIYNPRPDFGGLTTVVANEIRAFPENMGDPAVNRFGAQVTVVTPPDAAKTPGANGARQFQIDWPAVTADICSELAASVGNSVGVDVDGVEVFNRGVSDLDIGAIGANCDDGVTVSFVYGKN